MLKPKNELREFKTGTLKNGIPYTLIFDKDVENITASTAVKVGSFSEPKEYQGLAHFLEHMLFLGSNKYEKENYFDETLKKNSGYSNAYTAMFETVYYFTCISKNAEHILDIFSRFFIDPKFDVSSVNREINAVNSEHLKNANNDYWQQRNFLMSLSKKDSPINRFTTGNLETLNKPNLRDVMIKFYNKYYCSDNMSLTIISNIDFENMEKILSNTFENIQKKKSISIDYKVKPYFGNNIINQLIPVRNSKEILYFWEIPLFREYLNNKSWEVICQTIENDSKTNLKYILKSSNLIVDLDASVIDFGVLVLSIEFENNVDIFSIINKLNSYIQYYIDNLNKLNWKEIYNYYEKQQEFLFTNCDKYDETTLVDLISNNMLYYKEKYYYGSNLVSQKDYDYLLYQIENLKFKNCNVIVIDKNKSYHSNLVFNKLPYYNSEYRNLDKSYLSVNKKIKFSFSINSENKYLDVKPTIEKTNIKDPIIIKNNVWFGGLSEYNQPKIYLKIIYNINDLFSTIDNSNLTLLTVKILNYYLFINFYKLFELNYKIYFTIKNTYSSICLNITGYNDKFNEVVNDVFLFLKSIISKIDNIIIIQNLNDTIKDFENLDKSTPLKYLNILTGILGHDYNYPIKDTIKNLKKLELGTMKEYIKNFLLGEHNCVSIIYGNISKSKIPKILFELNKKSKDKIVCPKNLNSFDYIHPNPTEENNIVRLLVNFGIFDPLKTVTLLILEQILDEPIYYFLRTTHQLGYICKSGIYYDSINYYFYVIVQSIKDVDFVKSKILEILRISREKILKMKNEEIENFKKGLKIKLLEKESSNNDLVNKYFGEILSRKFLFNRNNLLVDQIIHVNKEKILQLYDLILEKYFFNIIRSQK